MNYRTAPTLRPRSGRSASLHHGSGQLGKYSGRQAWAATAEAYSSPLGQHRLNDTLTEAEGLRNAHALGVYGSAY
ncbi:hypothetical protein [Hymenobacter latericus]|uniref:hypothetical protein n=1 Tax=Hymenobacter sp. YIM 151858-1 TaxID=2987688 RepID=UPI002226423F|nr:hypothetical protein [Hymenobacter sp. YIM 151858-1]UYZ59657.1 hypothetical protein OIS50_02400 [Hymenobacter sp. YIM 151858-1]